MQHFPVRITPFKNADGFNYERIQPIEDEVMFRPSTIMYLAVFSRFNYNGVSLFNPMCRVVLKMAVHV